MVAAMKVSDNSMCFFPEQHSKRKTLSIIHDEKSIRGEKHKRQHVGNLDYSSHALYRARSRHVSAHEIEDTLKNPLSIGSVKHDDMGRLSQKIVGRSATVILNPDTNLVVTTYHTNPKLLRKLMKELGEDYQPQTHTHGRR